MTPAVHALLMAAKEPKQSLPEFLREAALTVALMRMDASQS